MEISLKGRIDSSNAAQTESGIIAQLPENSSEAVVIDCRELEYISSAGLRVILRIRKNHPDLKVINVNSDIYEILDMTGFTEMMSVEKAYRTVSIEGCEEIGRGANGVVYRIDSDNVVKVYYDINALEEIQRERDLAKLALILGIPTAISYDVVKVGDSYGSVFELLNASSFSKIMCKQPEKFDWCVQEYVQLLKKIHSTVVPAGKLTDVKDTVLGWARFMQDYLPGEAGRKLYAMVEEVPYDNHMIHGDYHTKNVELQNDEVLLIDMDTLATGHPIFELASMYNAFVGYSEYDHNVIMQFQGFDHETGKRFWHDVLAAYLETDNEDKIREVADKARIIGYSRMIRRSIRRKGLESEEGRKEIECWKKSLLELLDKYDTLLFDMTVEDRNENELEIEAAVDNLPAVMDFVNEKLEAIDCPPKATMQINIAAEEIFVNIAHYAYAPDKGNAIIRVEVSQEPVTVTMTFIDNGKPYDPLKRDEPDVTLPAEQREIGGLGIFMTRKAMDDITYEYRDGSNILTLKKHL